ncbi:DUF885 domain-containing protein [Arenimonas alkanexedens]
MLRPRPLILALALAIGAPPTFALADTRPATAQAQANAAATALHALFDADWERQLKGNPFLATYLGDARYNDRWPDASPTAIAQRHQANVDSRAALAQIDRAQLSPADQLNYDIYAAVLDDSIAGAAFPTERIPVAQDGGPHSVAESMLQVMQFNSEKDFRDWIARLRGYPGFLAQNTALMQAGIDSGWTAPEAIMTRLPPQIAAQLVDDPVKASFYRPFEKMPDSIPAATQALLRAEAQAAIKDGVLPALRDFQAFFNDNYLPAARQSVAAGDLPEGKRYYDHLAASYTTTDMSADDIHALGLKEVARIRARMDEIREEVGFNGDLQAFFMHLRNDASFHPKDAESLLAAYRALSKRVDPEVTKVFSVFPRVPYGVIPIPDAIAPDTTTAYYQPPTPDGKRAGYYYVNLHKPETRLTWEMVPLTLHEAVPGHHFQIALAQENGEQPMFRRMSPFTAYVEGWGLYAEQLGYDMGLYDDPYDRMGQLSYEMWRAVRLVVDTGMHAKGWSRQQAIDYFKANAPKSELDITNEIDRYIANPGQALAYKIGQLKFSELRARAEAKLGDRFDLRAFHDALLVDGAVPLSVLDARMDAWIDEQARRK